MAIDMDPAGKFDICMGEGEKARIFTFRNVTRRDAKLLGAALGQLQKLTMKTSIDDAESALDEIGKLVVNQLVGWKNVRDHRGALIRFNPKRFDEFISEGDLAELGAQLRVSSMLSADEKKALGSPVQSRRKRSARTARRTAAKT